MTTEPYLIWDMPWQLVTSIGSIGAAFSAVFIGQITKYYLDRKRDKKIRDDDEITQLLTLRSVLINAHINISAVHQIDFSTAINGRMHIYISETIINPLNAREDIKSINDTKIISAYSAANAAFDKAKRNVFGDKDRNFTALPEDIIYFKNSLHTLLGCIALLENRISYKLKLSNELHGNEYSITI